MEVGCVSSYFEQLRMLGLIRHLNWELGGVHGRSTGHTELNTWGESDNRQSDEILNETENNVFLNQQMDQA